MVQALLIFTLVVFAGIAIAVWHAQREKKRVLRELAAALGGTVEGDLVRAAVDGVSVSVHLTSRSSGKHSQPWTYVEAALPPGYPLTIYLRDHAWRDDVKIKRGDMVDVVIGDAVFDARFLVEGAPEAIVRPLLDEPLRTLLLRHEGCDLATEGGVIRLAIEGHLERAAAATPLVEAMTRLSRSVRDRSAEADRDVPLATTGDVYRGAIDDRPLQAARSARGDEVARVAALREHRAAKGAAIVVILAIVVGIAWLALVRSTR